MYDGGIALLPVVKAQAGPWIFGEPTRVIGNEIRLFELTGQLTNKLRLSFINRQKDESWEILLKEF